MKKTILLSVLILLSMSCYIVRAADASQNLAIRAGRIWTVTDGVIKDGVIIVKNGKIQALRKKPDVPEGMKLLDFSGKDVMPGLIDAHCHIGLSLDIYSEIDETVLAVTPDMQIIDAFNPLADDVKKALSSGVTTVLLAPGNKNPVGGQTAVVKLYGKTTKDLVLKRSAGVKFSLRDDALMSDRRPTSRAGLLALIREELNNAKTYKDDKPDLRIEVLKSVADANLAAFICAYTVDEIASALTVVDEYDLNAVLIGAQQGDEIAELIAGQNIPVIYSPLLLFSRDKDLKRVVKMADSGIKIAFSSTAPRTPLSDLRTSAIAAVKYGLDKEAALKGLTINAAQILGVSKRVGSIKKGKDADLVILSGDPLQATSTVEMVIINGNIVYQRQKI
ncbi:MAG: amidohydrolase family protein [Phycisphaerae bacterium]|nr:amidohydrolase family protein [Phycisphaerae bacterium]NIR65052.1 amidohydrolase family protein [candidate division Zixibacteria bacterium]NIP56235.1 amidohydrolase family protein [Phycisphaerae bacterium]NIS54688.1 amidohydrolase family protein [Phycisphaerae bacterium]NIU12279.1 amidohydrolase family protein [Phycisphaerae bacterium]